MDKNISDCKWEDTELQLFYLGFQSHGTNWKEVSALVGTRSVEECQALHEIGEPLLCSEEFMMDKFVTAMLGYSDVHESGSNREINDTVGITEKFEDPGLDMVSANALQSLPAASTDDREEEKGLRARDEGEEQEIEVNSVRGKRRRVGGEQDLDSLYSEAYQIFSRQARVTTEGFGWVMGPKPTQSIPLLETIDAFMVKVEDLKRIKAERNTEISNDEAEFLELHKEIKSLKEIALSICQTAFAKATEIVDSKRRDGVLAALNLLSSRARLLSAPEEIEAVIPFAGIEVTINRSSTML